MLVYFLIGVVWSFFLELSIVSKNPKADYNFGSRAFHILLWPVSITLFIIGFIKGYFDEE